MTTSTLSCREHQLCVLQELVKTTGCWLEREPLVQQGQAQVTIAGDEPGLREFLRYWRWATEPLRRRYSRAEMRRTIKQAQYAVATT